ncbi:MAG: alpha/beta hydrolase [Atopobiaceae bacterium]
MKIDTMQEADSMLHETIAAEDEGRAVPEVPHADRLALPKAGEPARIETYFPDVLDKVDPDVKRPCVALLPGGAYARVSAREAEPVALQMVARGFAACVISYSCAPARYPVALVQAAGAIAFLKHHAKEFHIDPERIYLMGFSAGAHLALDLGCEWMEPRLAERVGAAAEEMRPCGLVLGYPVVTSGAFAHKGSFDNLCGNDEELRQKLSLENRVTKDTPPAFIFHTLEDTSVPVENSLLLAQAYRRAGVSFTLHIFPYGGHGLSLATADVVQKGKQPQPLMQCWPDLAADWMRTL